MMKKQLASLNIYSPGKTAKEIQRDLNIKSEMMKLSSNENVYGPSPVVEKTLQAAIQNIHEYPDAAGTDLKQAISRFYQVPSEAILLGAGLDEVIQMLSRAVLMPGDEILTSEQTFVQYSHHAVIEDCKIVTAPLTQGKFDLNALLDKVTDKTALIWLCNPNNPTGNYFSEEELTTFLDKVGDVPVVLDEAYAEYVTAEDYPDSLKLRNQFENIIILRTFSKAYGLASLRIGYAISSDEWTDLWHRVKLPFNVTTLSLKAAEAALADQDYLKRIVTQNASERTRYYTSDFKNHLLPSETNFVFIEVEDASHLNDFLLRKGIIARPVSGGVRLTIGTRDQNDVIIEVLSEYFKEEG